MTSDAKWCKSVGDDVIDGNGKDVIKRELKVVEAVDPRFTSVDSCRTVGPEGFGIVGWNVKLGKDVAALTDKSGMLKFVWLVGFGETISAG